MHITTPSSYGPEQSGHSQPSLGIADRLRSEVPPAAADALIVSGQNWSNHVQVQYTHQLSIKLMGVFSLWV